MLDLVEQVRTQLGEVVRAVVQRVVERHADELGVGALLVLHPEHAERTGPHPAAREGRVLQQHQGVERVAVLGEGVGDEPVVGRVEGGREQAAVEPHHARHMVVLVLVAAPPGISITTSSDWRVSGARHGATLRRVLVRAGRIGGMATTLSEPTTLSEKVWERHVVRRAEGEPDLLYVDLHLVHEVTSPQAFDGLRLAGRGVRRPDLTVATMDHNVPTRRHRPARRATRSRPSRWRCWRGTAPSSASAATRWASPGQGIVHVIGPEQGLTQPGMTIVCGDSHTSTHGAFGALAFGIGTSEVEHVLATQTLPQARPGTMAITVDGDVPAGVTAKDIVLAIIGRIGTGGGHRLDHRVPRRRRSGRCRWKAA